MEFFAENYLWIIIAIIVILMAIVGYVADKTGFIKKGERGEKSQKEKVKEEKTEPVLIEAKGINELTNNTVKQDEPVVIENAMENNEFISALNDNPYDNVISNDLNNGVSMGSNYEMNSQNMDASNVYDNQEIDSSLFAPLGDVNTQNNAYENVEELPQVDITSLENVESQDSPVVNEEEDLWKF